MAGDGIKAEMAGKDPEEEEVPNEQLDYLLDFYECWDLYPFAERILWLDDVKEAVGHIPKNFNLSYQEIVGLTILMKEKRLKESYDAYKMRQQSRSVKTPPPVPSPPRGLRR